MDFNLIRCVVIVYTILIGLGGSILYYAEVYLPTSVIRLLCYGKIAKTRNALVEKFEIPKR